MGDTTAEKQFIERYVTPQREPAWLVNARQPESVYFSHAVHVKRANLKCERCHGDQARPPRSGCTRKTVSAATPEAF